MLHPADPWTVPPSEKVAVTAVPASVLTDLPMETVETRDQVPNIDGWVLVVVGTVVAGTGCGCVVHPATRAAMIMTLIRRMAA